METDKVIRLNPLHIRLNQEVGREKVIFWIDEDIVN